MSLSAIAIENVRTPSTGLHPWLYADTRYAGRDRIYQRLAGVKRDMGDIDGAVADLQTALSFNPNVARAYLGFAIGG